jgi:hypothetical protein
LETRSHAADKWQERLEPVSLRQENPKLVIFMIVKVLSWALAMNLVANSSPQSSAPKSQQEEQRVAVGVFRNYTRFEEKQDYAHIYDLLSTRFRLKLEREENVNDAAGYNSLRLGSEAQWSDFRIIKIEHQSNDGFKFLVTAKVEESGVVDNVKRTYDLIQDRGKWRIDGWEDPVVTHKGAE